VTVALNASGLTVENTGSGSALDPTQIFNRFYKNNPANTSTGLGLSIVKSIADYYGFTVNYNFNGSHSFTIVTTKA
jgi:signal transduction histidine kinase